MLVSIFDLDTTGSILIFINEEILVGYSEPFRMEEEDQGKLVQVISHNQFDTAQKLVYNRHATNKHTNV